MIKRRPISWTRRWRAFGRHEGNPSTRITYGAPLEGFDQLCCIALLGEPGSGKTQELDAARRRLAGTGHHVHLDLREYGSEERFVSDWRNAITQSMDQAGPVTLWLDALDEGLLNVKKLARLVPGELHRLKTDDLARLSLRVACRTGAWPKALEASLELIFFDPQAQAPSWVLELQDLDSGDLDVFRAETGINEGFSDAIARAGVEVFAMRPVTLWLLADIYAERGKLPASRWEVFEQALGHLIIESNRSQIDERTIAIPSMETALDLTGLVAAACLFSGRVAIDLGIGSRADDALRIAEIVHEGERATHLTALVRHTPLFKRRNDETFEFAHRTYAEFLLARIIERRQASDTDILAVISSADGFVVPHLREFAGWVAARRPEIRSALVEREPELALEGDPRELPRPLQLRTVRRLFERIAAQELLVAGGETVHLLHRLPIEVLLEAFRALFANPPAAGSRVVFDALLVVREAKLTQLTSDIAAFVANETAVVGDRQSASGVLRSFDETAARDVLRPYLMPLPDGSRHPLFGRALGALGATELSPSEFFGNIANVPDDGIVGGEAWSFVTSEVPSVVEKRGWQAEALEWASGQIDDYTHKHVWNSALERLVWNWAAFGVENAGVRQATGQLLQQVGRRYVSLQPESPDVLDRSLRRLLMGDAIALEDEDAAYAALRTGEWMLDRHDLTWLLEMYLRHSRPEVRHRVSVLIRDVVNVEDIEHGEILHSFAGRDPELRSSLVWFFGPVSLDDPGVVMQRQSRLRELEREKELAELGDPRDRVRAAVEMAASTPAAWWFVINELTVKPGMIRYGNFNRSLQRMPGWISASPQTRDGVLAAALSFIQHERPDVGTDWLCKNEFPEILLVGAIGVLALGALGSERLRLLSADAWRYWLPAVLRLGGMAQQSSEAWTAVAEAAPAEALSVIEEVARPILMSREDLSGAGFFLQRICDNPPFQTAGLRDLLVELIDSGALSETGESHCQSALVRLDPKIGLAVVTGCLERGKVTEGGLRAVLLAGEVASWPKALEAIRRDSDLGERVLGALVDRFASARPETDPSAKWPHGLCTSRLVELYELLVDLWPPTDGEIRLQVHIVGPREEIANLRNRLPMILAERGGAEECQELGRLDALLRPRGIDLRYPMGIARQNFRVRSWRTLSIAEILSLLGETPGSATAIRQSREELRALSPRTQASVLEYKSLHAMIRRLVLDACVQLLERVSVLPPDAEEDKYTDLLLADFAPRIQEFAWIVDAQSRGGRSAGTIAGRARGGVGERDVVLRHEGTAFAIMEALVLDSVESEEIIRHVGKLISLRQYNPTGLSEGVVLIYARPGDFTGFWGRYVAAIGKNVPAGITLTSQESVTTFSATVNAIDVTYSNGMAVLHVALAVGVVNG